MNTNQIRSKWAAVGAAIAITFGAGGIGITHATTSSGEKPIYLPIEPCRGADTRPDFQVGPRSSPLGPNETYTLSGWGALGDCTLPADTAGLALNVTAVDPTAATFLTLFPAGVPLPLASNLNPTPGEPPTPNAVNVDLNAAGDFSIYNLAGNVHIIIDVVGIYDDHNHDDRYYTEGEVDAALAAGFAMGPQSQITFTSPPNTDQVVDELDLPAGDFIVNASLVANNNAATPEQFGCRLFLGATLIAETAFNNLQITPNLEAGSRESVGLTGGGTLDAPGTASVVCQASTASGNWLGLTITAIKVSSVTRP